MGFMDTVNRAVTGFIADSGLILFFQDGAYKNLIMIFVALGLIYLAIKKKYEPLLLLPIAFGMLLANLPGNTLMSPPDPNDPNSVGGLLYYIYQGNRLVIFPPLIFMGVGALTDFAPLIANPKSIMLGLAAQLGIFATFIGAIMLGFPEGIAAAIAIIGGADGPTSIYTATILAPEYLSRIAVAAYSYMALVPIIQPPIIYALTTEKERAVSMEQLRPVSQNEKIIFPIIVTIFVAVLLPSAVPLISMLMFGNLLKVSGVTDKLAEMVSGPLMYIIIIFIGLTVGATTEASSFLTLETLLILVLGLSAFAFSTASGVIFGKIMHKTSGGKVNPIIGAASVSALPMSARIVQKIGQEANPNNHLLMHAMGPTVSSIIATAVVSGIFLSIYGG